jgi:hypothetical protein
MAALRQLEANAKTSIASKSACDRSHPEQSDHKRADSLCKRGSRLLIHRFEFFLIIPAAPPCASPWHTSAHDPVARL